MFHFKKSIMKKLYLLAFVAAVMMSCGMEVVKTGPEYGFELLKSDKFEDVDMSKLPDIGGVKVQGDYVSIQYHGKYYDYKINSVNSNETVRYATPRYYTWVFDIEKVSPSAQSYDGLIVKKYMDDIYPADPEMCDYVNVFEKGYNANGGYVWPYDVKGRVDIPRHFLKNYEETKLPELKFTNLEFEAGDDGTVANIPPIVGDAKSIVVKGTTVEISDGKNNVSLEIFPYSDHEYGDGSYYCYDFYTKPTADCPKLSFSVGRTLNADDGIILLVGNEDADALIGGFNIDKDDFLSWGNLKRNICVCHPSDEEYDTWKKSAK